MLKRMKKLSLILFPIAIISAIIGLNSCSEELPDSGESVVTPVIVGLLDKSDSLHYIKVTRSFAGNNNALIVAQIADSSYYEDVEVKVEEYTPNNGSGPLVLRRTWTLRDTILTNKEPGAFYSPNQKVYYYKTDVYNSLNPPSDISSDPTLALKPNATYKFVAVVNGGEYTVNAETKLVDDVTITYPLNLAPYSFASYTGNAFNSYSTTNCKANIGNSEKSSQVVDARIKITIREYFAGVPVDKSFFWKIGELNGSAITSDIVTLPALGQNFYTIVKQNVTTDPTIDKRQLISMVLTYTGGTDELSKYILVNKPSTSLAQNKPIYTNVTCSDGRQALGIFSSRNKSVQTKTESSGTRAISVASMRQLCTGSITGSLLFCSQNAGDSGESYFCN